MNSQPSQQARSANMHLSFMQWYLFDRPGEILQMYMEYAQAFGEMFAIVFLLKTLFSPWKSIRDDYPDKGFNLTAILETWSLNATTRAIGAAIRLATIIVGILLQIALFVGFLAYLIFWIAFPLVCIVGIPVFLLLIAR